MAEASQKPSESENPRNLDALAASEAGGVVDALDQHRTKILGAIALGAVVLCAVLIVNQVRKQKHLAAGSAYSSAAAKGEIAALDAVLVDYPGSIAAGNALLTKADLQIKQGKPEDARATLERFVGEFAAHPRHAQGLFALADLFHVAGDLEMAKSHYERVIALQGDRELTPLARIRLGDLALESGDTAAADQRYQEAYSLHPGTPFFDYAEEKIALLKVGEPTEVERPAPPAAPADPTKVDAPKATSAPATPKADAPKPAAPAPAAPKADAPKPAAPAPAAPQADAPKPAAPAPAAPKADAPKPAAPAPAAPKADAPKPAAPAPAAPQADAPKPAAPAPANAQ